MKKIRIIGMVLVAIIMGVNFTSCKPDDTPEDEPAKKLVMFGHNGNEKILNYDDQGHLIGYSEIMAGIMATYTFVWGENTIDITLDLGGLSQEKCTLKLENGLASEISENTLTFSSSFKYNSSNRLIECKNWLCTRSLEWNDDKLMVKHDTVAIGTGKDTYTYNNNTTKGYNPLIPFIVTPTELLYVAHPELAGLASQKLIDTEYTYDLLGFDEEYTYSYKYEYGFDEDGYVNKVIVRHNEEDCEHIVNEYTFVWE